MSFQWQLPLQSLRFATDSKVEDPISSLSVILCNYNHAKYIPRAMEAILAQSRPPDQLIVVDDGSTDDSVAVIESWAAKYPVVWFIKNDRNLGFHASAAKALAAATGDYVYCGSADDYILPGFFENVCGLMDSHLHADLGCAKVVTALPDGRRVRSDGFEHFSQSIYIPPPEFLRLCLDAEPPTLSLASATVYRREALLKVGGWRKELGSWADTFSIRAIGLSSGLCYVPQEGAMWFIQPGSISQSTLSDPSAGIGILRKAAELMRSPEFSSIFPADHVKRWEAASFEALVLQQLQPAIEGYQAVQKSCRETATLCSWPLRCLLGIVRRAMTGCYVIAHHLQRHVIRKRLLKLRSQVNGPQN